MREIDVAAIAADALETAEDVGEFSINETWRAIRTAVSPLAVARETAVLGAELARIAVGKSAIEPQPRDWRFKDDAWEQNAFYKRLGQSYLAMSRGIKGVVNEDADWRNRERARFALEVLSSALAPTNTLWGNPAALKKAFDTGGMSLVRGLKNFVGDVRHNGGMPTMVDASPFEKGENIAATPGAVVFRNEILELLQYSPQTEQVFATPTLLIPPQINKYYFTDLAPGRSLVEYAVQQGVQMYVVSWRNPGKEQADWDLDTYVGALLEAIDAINSITRRRKINTIGFCAGGITMSALLAYMAATNDRRVNAISYAVTLLDWSTPSMMGMLQSEYVTNHARRKSRKKGIISGQDLGSVFAWFRPNELVWNYWVNNYLMGEAPPSFDILAWNADATNLPGSLHAQFLDIFMLNSMTNPGEIEVLGQPVDLGRITADAFVVGAIDDHLTPWKGCYETTQLLGGDSTFVLSNAGHIAALVNPPGNPKASYRLGPEPGKDPVAWLDESEKHTGSWWQHWSGWIGERSGNMIDASASLGNKRYPVLDPAPGTYIYG
ncbi:MAG: alpha/beta fold hydrolase [Gammaproteobacteria bacterium]|nr:alpha/beta fold hydrolase [Gammaproteobacteria bacterium]